VAFARAEPKSGVDFYLLAPIADISAAETYDLD
jgi:hypothetical protein